MPENTASTTMIPQIGTNQCLIQAAERRWMPKYASTEMCRHRNPLRAPKFTIRRPDRPVWLFYVQGHGERQGGRDQHAHVRGVVAWMDSRQDSRQLSLAPHGEHHARHAHSASAMHSTARRCRHTPTPARLRSTGRWPMPPIHTRRPAWVLDRNSRQQIAEHPGHEHEKSRG